MLPGVGAKRNVGKTKDSFLFHNLCFHDSEYNFHGLNEKYSDKWKISNGNYEGDFHRIFADSIKRCELKYSRLNVAHVLHGVYQSVQDSRRKYRFSN